MGSDSQVVSAVGAWTATSSAPSWLHIQTPNGTGNGLATFTFDLNTGATRTGTLTIAGTTLNVTQAGIGYVAANPVSAIITAGLASPRGVAADSAGDLYIADSGDNAIKEWNAATQTLTTLVPSTAGLNSPYDVAVDSAGNVYIADYGNNAIEEWNPTTKILTPLVTSGLSSPVSVAVDGAGDVFIVDLGTDSIKEWHAGTLTTLVIPELISPNSIAVDAADNLYITNYNTPSILVWHADTQMPGTPITTGLYALLAVAVDGEGNVYASNNNNGSIVEWHAATQSISTWVSSGINQTVSLAVDPQGNVYVPDATSSAIEELPNAFVPGAAISETSAAGSDALLPVLLTTQSLSGVFVPTTDDASWLSINSVAGGVINFSFTANGTGAARTAHLTVLGQSITVTQAGQVIWSGGSVTDSFWTSPANWGGTTVVANDSLDFAGGNRLSNTNDFTADTQFIGITFDASAGAFVLGGNAINLSGNIANNSSNTQTINLPLVLTGNRTLTAAAGNLTVGGNIGESGGHQAIVVSGPGIVTFSGANSYSGGTTVSSGTLIVTSASALQDGSDLTVGASESFFPGPSIPALTTAVAATIVIPPANSAEAISNTTAESTADSPSSTCLATKASPDKSADAALSRPVGQQAVDAVIAQQYSGDRARRAAAAICAWPADRGQEKDLAVQASASVLAQYGV